MISFTGLARVGKRGREVVAATVKRLRHSDDAASRARKGRPVANASILWREASTAIPVRPGPTAAAPPRAGAAWQDLPPHSGEVAGRASTGPGR